MVQDNKKEIITVIESYLHTSVLSIERVSGGLVHYVYKLVTNNNNILFVKNRKSHYSALPHISTDPNLIAYEKNALEIVSKIAPKIFPKLLGYVQEKHLLILSDIMPNRKTLETDLNNFRITSKDTYRLGKLLAEIHKKLAYIKKSIREDGDVEFYNQLLHYRFGYHSHPALDETVISLNSMSKQLILGDLSPKNIGILENGMFTICDLENMHRGNTLSDVGFLGSSLLLHTMNNLSLAKMLFSSFLKGYKSELNIDAKTITLKRVVLGIALYRIANPVIPYELRVTEFQRKQKEKLIRGLLNNKRISWDKLIDVIVSR